LLLFAKEDGVAICDPITASKAVGDRFMRAVGGIMSVEATVLGDAITAQQLHGG